MSLKKVFSVSFLGPILDDLDDEQMYKLIQISPQSGNPICGICLKEYRSRQSTLDHLRVAHTQKSIHKCLYCSMAFKTKHLRSTHISQKHREAHRASLLLKKVVRCWGALSDFLFVQVFNKDLSFKLVLSFFGLICVGLAFFQVS